MANPDRGEFDITLGGNTYTVTLKTAGLIALQHYFSTPEKRVVVSDVLKAIEEGSIEHQVAFVWAALRKHHPDVTFEQTVELVDESGGIHEVFTRLADVLESTTPDQADIDELPEPQANPRKAQARRGTGATGTFGRAKSA